MNRDLRRFLGYVKLLNGKTCESLRDHYKQHTGIELRGLKSKADLITLIVFLHAEDASEMEEGEIQLLRSVIQDCVELINVQGG